MVSAHASAIAVGLGLFLIAGFQTVQYRDYLNLTQQDFQSVPVYIVAETLVAFVLGLWGFIGVAGTFKPINPYASQRGLDANVFRPDFQSFNHRGHLIPLAANALK